MEPYYQAGSVTVFHGDCIEVLRTLPDESVHAVVTDPPYGLGFMGKKWDGLPPGIDFAVEALRVLKPGGYLLAFGGTRTWHRLAVAIEDAGFEIRDSIAWMHGQGFPKGKANLKPAFEPIVVGRKIPTPGGGKYNIDAARIGERWPANVVLDESQAVVLDAQSGLLKSGERRPTAISPSSVRMNGSARTVNTFNADSGGASRFFYVAKAARVERPAVGGVQHPTVKPLALMRWLVRLVTPAGGTLLDPFAGSGTTLEAAVLEGFKAVGIEREADYLPLILHRINKPNSEQPLFDFGGVANDY